MHTIIMKCSVHSTGIFPDDKFFFFFFKFDWSCDMHRCNFLSESLKKKDSDKEQLEIHLNEVKHYFYT